MKKMPPKRIPGIVCSLLALFLCLLLPYSVNAQEGARYLVPEADTRYYTQEEISNMPLQVVCYAKNEIYARHGRMFDSAELQGYFNRQTWYSGQIKPADFSDALLNRYESSNVSLLSKRENALQNGGYLLDQAGYSYSEADNHLQNRYAGHSFYIFEDSSTRYLTSSDTQYMTLQEICYGKNEIYARHGRQFDSTELQEYFNSQTWYNGTVAPGSFNEGVFNSYESTNVQYLTKLEKSLTDNKGYALDQKGYDISLVGNYQYYSDAWMWDVDYIFSDSSTRYLTREELQNYSPRVLCYAKNEIYARRGRLFNSLELQEFFNSKFWYNGQTAEADFSTDIFNQYEAQNVKLLKDMEFAREPGGYVLY